MNPIVIHRMLAQSLHRRSQRLQINRLLDAVGQQKDKLEVSERKLQRKNAQLEELCKASQKFVNNVSHEFRTPLCVVRQYASLIADGVVGDVNEEQRRMLKVVEARVDDLSTMVDDILDISRHESGLLAASRDVATAQAIVDQVLPSHQQRAALRGIDIDFEIEPNLPALYCDAEKVSRTLINLLTNATKFSQSGERVRLVVELANDGKDVRFAVADSGQGIAPEDCEAIFQRFRQSGSQFGQSTRGFGLGLSIAKELVDLNLGEMSVESELGVGSIFSFTVPIHDNIEIVRRFVRRADELSGSTHRAVCAIQLSVEQTIGDDVSADEIHSFLNYVVRSRDLLIRVGPQAWFVLLGNLDDDQERFISRLCEERSAINRNRPMGKIPSLLAHQSQYVCTSLGDIWLATVLASTPPVVARSGDAPHNKSLPVQDFAPDCKHTETCEEACPGIRRPHKKVVLPTVGAIP